MPTHIRAMCSWQVGTLLPRDAMQITPCFRHQAVLPGDDPNWENLANDLSTALNGYVLGTRQQTVRLYDLSQPPINRPKAIVTTNPGAMTEAPLPREIALCLSFNGGNNEPHNRGRLFLPFPMISGGIPSTRPTLAMRQKVADLVPIFAGLGGVDVDWIVWSPTRAAATKVERWFVDDEWDTQRRRGLKPAERLAGETGG